MKLVSSKLNIITIILMLILVSIIVYLTVSSQVKKFKYESTGLVVIIMIIAIIYLQKTNKSKEGFESSPSFDFVLGGLWSRCDGYMYQVKGFGSEMTQSLNSVDSFKGFDK